MITPEEDSQAKYLKYQLEKMEDVNLHFDTLKVDFSLNQIGYLSFRENCQLQEINFSNNYLQGVKGIKNCPKLKILNLSYNSIKTVFQNIQSMGELQYCTNLTQLNLSYNIVQSLSFLLSCINLKQLDLSYNVVTNIEPIRNCTLLQSLIFDDNQVQSINCISQLTSLRKVSFKNNRIKNISCISSLKNIQYLNCSGNQLIEDEDQSAFASFTELTKLTELYCSDMQPKITKLNGLQNCINMRIIHFHRNAVKELSPLEKCVKIQVLVCYQNEIVSMEALQKWPSNSPLKILNARGNLFNNIQFARRCPNLQSLNIQGLGWGDEEKIKSLDPLSQCKQLKILFSKQQIQCLQPLKKLDKLESIDVSNNQIYSLSPLLELPYLKSLCVNENYIDKNQIKSFEKKQKLKFIYSNQRQKQTLTSKYSDDHSTDNTNNNSGIINDALLTEILKNIQQMYKKQQVGQQVKQQLKSQEKTSGIKNSKIQHNSNQQP